MKHKMQFTLICLATLWLPVIFSACAGNTAAANQTTPADSTITRVETTTPVELTFAWPSPAATVPPGLIFRADRLYTDWHLWVKQESADTVRLGVTYYGQLGLGKPDDMGMPQLGTVMLKGSSFNCYITGDDCMIYDFAAPVNGIITAVNERLLSDPRLVNTSPYDEGWLVVVKIDNPAELKSLLTYEQYFNTSCPPCHCNH